MRLLAENIDVANAESSPRAYAMSAKAAENAFEDAMPSQEAVGEGAALHVAGADHLHAGDAAGHAALRSDAGEGRAALHGVWQHPFWAASGRRKMSAGSGGRDVSA